MFAQAIHHHAREKKHASFWLLALFIVSFPLLEGYSNEYVPIGTKYLGFLLVFVWAIECMFFRSTKFVKPLLLLLLFVIWNIVTILWTIDYGSSVVKINGLVNVCVFYWVIIDVLSSRERFNTLVVCYVVGVMLVVITAMINIAYGATYMGLHDRFSAMGIDPNNFGIMLCSIIPFVVLGINTTQKKHMQYILFAIILVCAIAVVSTASRASAVALVLLPLVYIWNGRRNMRPGKLLLLLAFICIGGYLVVLHIVPGQAVTRILSSRETGVMGGRLYPWTTAIEIGMENPLTGLGTGSFFSFTSIESEVAIQAHNTFLSAFAETGIIGLILWTGIWIYHFKMIYAAKTGNAIQQQSRLALMLSLGVIFIGAMTLNWEIRKPLYLIWGLIATNKYINNDDA